MADSVTLTLPLPHPSLCPNSRGHWRKAFKHERALKNAAYIAACASPLKNARLKVAYTKATFYNKDKRTRDRDNFLGRLKYAFDGFAEAGVIENDSGFFHHPVEFRIDKENPRVEVRITRKESA